VEAAEAAATAAEEAAGVSNSSSNAGEEEGISSLTLLKMVRVCATGEYTSRCNLNSIS